MTGRTAVELIVARADPAKPDMAPPHRQVMAFTESVVEQVAFVWLAAMGPSATMSACSCVLVKRILRKYGYPPDKQEKATQTVGAGGRRLDGALRDTRPAGVTSQDGGGSRCPSIS